MSCCAACAERDRLAIFGATPGWDDYLGPLRHGYPPLYLPYGQSLFVGPTAPAAHFGQIAGMAAIRTGVQPWGSGGRYRPPYAYFGRGFAEHVARGPRLAAELRLRRTSRGY